MNSSYRKQTFVWHLIAAITVGVLGALNLHFPFVSDQAVAMIAAKTLQSGGTLYVDFWDNKMPALIWFYWVAGELFGYSEFGVHLLELIWMGCFSLTLMVGLRDYYFHSWLSALAAIAVVGTYYVAAESFQLTQLEILVGFPILLSALLATKARSAINVNEIIVYSFFSGIIAGVAVCFKLIFAPLFVFFWIVASFCAVRGVPQAHAKRILWIWASASAGVLLIVGAVVLKFHLDGALKELYWTAFVYPPAALQSSPPAPFYRLLTSMAHFVSYYATWSFFIVVALLHWWRSDRHNPVTIMIIGWLIIGTLLIIVQKFSWWTYHVYILFPPAGILGVRGLDVTAQFLSRNVPALRIRPMLLTLFLLIPCVGSMLVPTSQKISGYVHVFLRGHGNMEEFQETINPKYAAIRKSIRFLNDSESRKGAIYVFGDPLYYHLSGRKPAAPIIGSALEYFLDEQLRELPRQLTQSKPPYIYVDVRNAINFNARQLGIPQFIGTHYAELFDDSNGTWYGAKPRSWPE